jgi:hypothetical protein
MKSIRPDSDTFRKDYRIQELSKHRSFSFKYLINDLRGFLEQRYANIRIMPDINSVSNDDGDATINATINLDSPLKIRMMLNRFELDQATGKPPVNNPNSNDMIFIDDMVELIIKKESGNEGDFTELGNYILASIQSHYSRSYGGRRVRRMRRTKTRARCGKKRATRRRRV